MRYRLALVAAVGLWGCRTAPAPSGTPASALPPPAASSPTAAAPAAAGATSSTYEMPVEVIEERFRFAYDAEGRRTYERMLRFRILRIQDVGDWGQIVVQYRTGHQARPELEAVVRATNGRVDRLDPSTIADSAASSSSDILDDRHVLRAPIPALTNGAEVEMTTRIADTRPFFDAGGTEEIVLGYWKQAVPTTVEISLPAKMPFHYVLEAIEGTPVDREADGVRKLTFDWPAVPGHAEQPWLLPPDVPRLPQLRFATGGSWSAVVDAYNAEVEPLIAQAPRNLGPVIPKNADRQRILRELVGWLHEHIRYTGLEMGRGAIIPRPPAETLKRRYGDCKDKSVLLIAMLRARGIDAHLALVRSGVGPDVLEALPGIDAFNHAIVHVPGNPSTWIDATADLTPVGVVPVSVQDRLSLVVRPGEKGLTRIPRAPREVDAYFERRVVRLGVYGKGRVEEHSEARGTLAAGLRSNFVGRTPAQVDEQLTRYVKDVYSATSVSGVRIGSLRSDAPVFEVDLVAEEASVADAAGSSASVRLDFSILIDWLPTKLRNATDDDDPAAKALAERTVDVVLHRPYVAELVYEVHPAPGFVPRRLPKGRKVGLGGGEMSSAFRTLDGGVVQATFRIDTGPNRRTADQARALAAGLSEFWAKNTFLLEFDHGGARLMSSGKDREGVAVYQDLVRRFPKDPYHRAELAQAYLDVGLGAQAHDEIEAAVALRPDDWELRHRGGWILSHDRLGREFGLGYDMKGAEAHYRRALRLNDEAFQTRFNLANLLQHDARGEVYTDPDRTQSAIQQLELLLDTPQKEDAAISYLVGLLELRRFEAIEDKVDDLPASRDRDVVRLVAAAVLRGVPAAVAEAEAAGLLKEDRTHVLSAAANTAGQLRAYPVAAELMVAGGRGAEDPLAFQRLGGLYRRLEASTKGREESPEADRWVRELISDAARNRIGHDGLAKRVSRRVPAQSKVREFATGLVIGARQGRMKIEAANLPAEVAFDSPWLEMEVASQGNDERGYRVSLRYKSSDVQMLVYLVRESGALRLRAVQDAPEEFGREALARLSKGHLAQAQTWLDWARQDARGDDPWTMQQFRSQWRRDGARDAVAVRSAANILLALGAQAHPGVVRAVSQMRRDAAKNRPEKLPAYRRLELLALVGAGDDRAAARLLEETPDLARDLSLGERRFEMWARLQRWDALAEDAGRVLDAVPGDFDAAIALVQAAAWTGRLKEVHSDLRDRAKEDRSKGSMAFAALLAGALGGTVSELDLDRAAEAAKSVSLSERHRTALALAYAELDRPKEALQVLRNLTDDRLRADVADSDAFILGRIFEVYGLDAPARKAYQRSIKGNPKGSIGQWYARLRHDRARSR